MRTTLMIDDDVWMAVKSLATRQRRSIGEVISDLTRQSLYSSQRAEGETRNGITLLRLTADRSPVTLELVNRIREELS